METAHYKKSMILKIVVGFVPLKVNNRKWHRGDALAGAAQSSDANLIQRDEASKQKATHDKQTSLNGVQRKYGSIFLWNILQNLRPVCKKDGNELLKMNVSIMY